MLASRTQPDVAGVQQPNCEWVDWWVTCMVFIKTTGTDSETQPLVTEAIGTHSL